MITGVRGGRTWRGVTLAGVVVCALVVGAVLWAFQSLARGADPRDYLRAPDDVVYGDGSLGTVLTRYGVALPAHASQVRFHDEESPIGSQGTLYLHLEVPDSGLTSLLRALHLGPLTSGLPEGWDPRAQGHAYGWTFQGGSWLGAQGPMDGTVSDSVAVVRNGTVDSVYLVAEHA